MGICLDTEQQRSNSRGEDSSDYEDEADSSRPPTTTTANNTANRRRRNQQGNQRDAAANITFQAPRVPVVFVIGGPGSGKVTHCDNLVLEHPRLVHINMADLLQQYALGNEMKDFGELSSKTVIEVLMLEMKMAASASAYLVSGFPRNMRDVVEYSDKIQVVNGIVIINWRRKALERQISYGAKLGQVVLRLARMELRYFFHHTISVAEYFDQRGMLLAVSGERDPNEVYLDFRAAVYRLMEIEGPAGRVLERRPSEEIEEFNDREAIRQNSLSNAPRTLAVAVETHQPSRLHYPSVIWVLGGPGSNKSSLCQRALRKGGSTTNGWVQFSLGRTLRTISIRNATVNNATDKRSPMMLLSSRSPSPTNPRSRSNSRQLRQLISSGEMAPTTDVEIIVESQMEKCAREGARGIVIDGFPRDLNQLSSFEIKYGQKPYLILLDCSKLQLGRGRFDDSVSAFRRRLQLFRELTLPMLRMLDQMNRLRIVDGDTDSPLVQDEFFSAISHQISQINSKQQPQTRYDERQSRQANGLLQRPRTKPTTNTSFQSATLQREITNDDIETVQEEDVNSRTGTRGQEMGNGIGIRGVIKAKEWDTRHRVGARMGNGTVRSLQQQPAPPPYQDNYTIQDSYI